MPVGSNRTYGTIGIFCCCGMGNFRFCNEGNRGERAERADSDNGGNRYDCVSGKTGLQICLDTRHCHSLDTARMSHSLIHPYIQDLAERSTTEVSSDFPRCPGR